MRLPVVPLLCLLTAAIAFPAVAGPNIYPDPGFEADGVPGVAHSGEKAGHLSVAAQAHWVSTEKPLKVEPFARYRMTEWVKASIGSGALSAPHCYQWDSYEWAFSSARPVGNSTDWVQTELTFISPSDTMCVSTLAFSGAQNSEAWVDDVVVEKIQEPEQAMAEVLAKAQMTEDDKRLSARWLVKRGDVEGAARVMRSCDGLPRADIATVIALALPDKAQRRPYVVEAVAYGGPTYYGGMDRFNQMAQGMDKIERVAVALDAARQNPTLDRAGRSVGIILRAAQAGGTGPALLSEQAKAVDAELNALRQVLSAIPADSAAGAEVKMAMQTAEETARAVEENKARLGRCRVLIGGQRLSPRSSAIITPVEPTPQELYAARELRYHLELITGRAIPLQSEDAAAPETALYVGKCEKALGCGIDFAALGLEGIHIKTDGKAVVLAGNQRGVLYATYQLLEDYLGCRWFTPDCAAWPREGRITVPEIDLRYIPPLEYRGGDYPIARDGEFSLRLRLNGANHPMTAEQGSRVGVHSLAHTFAALCPPEKHFAEHPEYFSLVGGERQSGYAQLCLTNPDVLRICTEGVKQWIKSIPDCKVFSVSQNDTANYCECEECTAVADEEGSQSGPVVRFVNAIADAIKDEFPDVAIETLAYQYTRKPPLKTKPRPNVIICLCSIECCFSHPLGEDDFNKTFARDIQGWNKICDRLWIWDYIINYAHSIAPFPNLQVLRPNIDFFINNGVKGIYEESCYFTKGSELQELRNYVMAKSLWDPSYNTDKAIDEFCGAYYGAAAPFVLEYLDLAKRTVLRDPKIHMMIYSHPKSYLTEEMVAEARGLFDQAEAAVANDPALLHRVQVARLPVIYAEIAMGSSGAWAERDGRLVQVGGTDVSELADQFERIARAEGVTRVREGGPDADVDAWLSSLNRKPREMQTIRLRNAGAELAIVPGLGGRIWRLQVPPGGRDVLNVYGRPDAWDPASGGYEEYSGSGYRSPGWSEDYAVVDRSDSQVTLQATLRNGLRLTRTVSLEGDRPLVRISSKLDNPTDGTRTGCLRIHPEFSLTDVERAKVLLGNADGTWRTHSLANPENAAAEKDTFFGGDDAPQGVWALVDEAADCAIVNRVPSEQVARYLANRSGAEKRATLELYSPEVKLEAGQSISIDTSYEIGKPAELGLK